MEGSKNTNEIETKRSTKRPRTTTTNSNDDGLLRGGGGGGGENHHHQRQRQPMVSSSSSSFIRGTSSNSNNTNTNTNTNSTNNNSTNNKNKNNNGHDRQFDDELLHEEEIFDSQSLRDMACGRCIFCRMPRCERCYVCVSNDARHRGCCLRKVRVRGVEIDREN
mmetsp:Transcript_18596/g.34440  ORF Transcript_18596/g.34440 Transcript_18596/m.34440 type:complete len:164 (-) Transcript_18596:2215-2706(-)